MAEPVLELRDVCFNWPDGRALFSGLSFSIAKAEKVVLLGPNGAGKSTLLRLVNGLLQPQSGAIFWQNTPLTAESLRQREFSRAFRRENVLLFQHPEAMLFNPTVREEIAYGPNQLGLPDVDGRVMQWATALGLSALLDEAPFVLSGGQKQKLALACLLVLEPQFLALDEPSASLDPATVGWLIDTLFDSGQTVLVSTHNLSLARELGERALVLDAAGRLIYDGALDQALADPALMLAAGLAHRHRSRHHHGAEVHLHDWDSS